MTIVGVPSVRNLKKLSLRASTALSLRATQRVAELVSKKTTLINNSPSISDERIFNIRLLIVKSFCNGELNRDSTRLAGIMENAK